MKKSNLLILILVLIIATFASGCVQNGEKEETEPAMEDTVPKTEIVVTGFNDLVMKIAPTNDSTISGIVTITATDVSSDTEAVSFSIKGKGVPPIQETGPNLGIDFDGTNGWSWILDTSEYSNGVYEIQTLAHIGIEEGEDPIATSMAQVIIQN